MGNSLGTFKEVTAVVAVWSAFVFGAEDRRIATGRDGVPESYNGLVTALESHPDADQSLEYVKQDVK